MIGSKISQYGFVGTLCSDGMGAVYIAQYTTLDRTKALTFLPEDSFDDASARSRFQREARAASALNHPHVSVIHEFGVEDHPFGPESVDRLAEVLDSTDGPILIHCGYGGRGGFRSSLSRLPAPVTGPDDDRSSRPR